MCFSFCKSDATKLGTKNEISHKIVYHYMTSYSYIIMIIVNSCIIWFHLDCSMQLKKSYYFATNVSSRKSATTFGDLPDCLVKLHRQHFICRIHTMRLILMNNDSSMSYRAVNPSVSIGIAEYDIKLFNVHINMNRIWLWAYDKFTKIRNLKEMWAPTFKLWRHTKPSLCLTFFQIYRCIYIYIYMSKIHLP